MACYCHVVSTLQVKRLPEDVHAALKRRAQEEGLSMSDLVTRILRRDLALPSVSRWLETVPGAEPPGREVDIEQLLDRVRDEKR